MALRAPSWKAVQWLFLLVLLRPPIPGRASSGRKARLEQQQPYVVLDGSGRRGTRDRERRLRHHRRKSPDRQVRKNGKARKKGRGGPSPAAVVAPRDAFGESIHTQDFDDDDADAADSVLSETEPPDPDEGLEEAEEEEEEEGRAAGSPHIKKSKARRGRKRSDQTDPEAAYHYKGSKGTKSRYGADHEDSTAADRTSHPTDHPTYFPLEAEDDDGAQQEHHETIASSYETHQEKKGKEKNTASKRHGDSDDARHHSSKAKHHRGDAKNTVKRKGHHHDYQSENSAQGAPLLPPINHEGTQERHHHGIPEQATPSSKSKSKSKSKSRSKSKMASFHQSKKKHYKRGPKSLIVESPANIFESTVLLELDPDSPDLSRTQSHLLEQTFLETYNALTYQMCDPLQRELTNVRIVFIDNTSLLVHARGECLDCHEIKHTHTTLFSEPLVPYLEDPMLGSIGTSRGTDTGSDASGILGQYPQHNQHETAQSTEDPRPTAPPNTLYPTTLQPTTAEGNAAFDALQNHNEPDSNAPRNVDGSTSTPAPTKSTRRTTLSPINVPTNMITSEPSIKVPTLSTDARTGSELDSRDPLLPKKPKQVHKKSVHKLRRSAGHSSDEPIDIGGFSENRFLGEQQDTQDRDDLVALDDWPEPGQSSRRSESRRRPGRGLKGSKGCQQSRIFKTKSKKSKSRQGGLDECCDDSEYAKYRAPTELEFTHFFNKAIRQVPELRTNQPSLGDSPFLGVVRTVELKQVMCSAVEEMLESSLLVQFVGDQDQVTNKEIEEVEQAIKDTYMSLQSARCDDPYFRQLDDVMIQSITQSDLPGTFLMEFRMKGTCRGPGCSKMTQFFDSVQQRRLQLHDNKHSFLSYMSRFESIPEEESLCLCPVFSDVMGPPDILDFTDQLSLRIEELHANGVLPNIKASAEVTEEDAGFIPGPVNREPFSSFITVGIFGDDSAATMDEINIIERILPEVYNELQVGFCDPISRICTESEVVFFDPTPSMDSSFLLSFQVEASCLGEGCSDNAMLFDEARRRRLQQLGPLPCEEGQEMRAPTIEEFEVALDQRIMLLYRDGVLTNIKGSGTVMEDQSMTQVPGATELPTFQPSLIMTAGPTAGDTPEPTMGATTTLPVTIPPSNVGDTITPTTMAQETASPTGLRGTIVPTGTGSSGEITISPSAIGQTIAPTGGGTANVTAAPSSVGNQTSTPAPTANANQTLSPTATGVNATAAPTAGASITTVSPTGSREVNATSAPSAAPNTTMAPSAVANQTTFQPTSSENATIVPTAIVPNDTAVPTVGNQTTAPTVATNQTTAPTMGNLTMPPNATLVPTIGVIGNETQAPSFPNGTMAPNGTLAPSVIVNGTMVPTTVGVNETLVPSVDGNMTMPPNGTLAPSVTMNGTVAPTLINDTLVPSVGGNVTTAPSIAGNGTFLPNATLAPSVALNGTSAPTTVATNETTAPTVGNLTLPPNATLVPTIGVIGNDTQAPSSPNGTVAPNGTLAPSVIVNGTMVPTIAGANETLLPSVDGNMTMPPNGTLAPSVGMNGTVAPTLIANETLVPSADGNLTSPPSMAGNMTTQPNGTLAPSVGGNVTLAPTSVVANETLVPSAGVNMTSAPSMSPNGTLPPNGTLAPSVAINGTSSPTATTATTNITMAPSAAMNGTTPPNGTLTPSTGPGGNETSTSAPGINGTNAPSAVPALNSSVPVVGNETLQPTVVAANGTTTAPSLMQTNQTTAQPTIVSGGNVTLTPTADMRANATMIPSLGTQTTLPTASSAANGTSAPTVPILNDTSVPVVNQTTSQPTVPGGNATVAPTGALPVNSTLLPTVSDGNVTLAPSSMGAGMNQTTVTPTSATNGTIPGETGAPTAMSDNANATNAPSVGSSINGTVPGETGAPTVMSDNVTVTNAPSAASSVNGSIPADGATSVPTVMSTNTTATNTTSAPGVTGAPSVNGTAMGNSTGGTNSTIASRVISSGLAADHTVGKSCTDSSLDIFIGVDLQLVFPGNLYRTCEDAETVMILETVQATLNVAFPLSVPDWKGTASFGHFDLDDQQFVNNADGVAGERASQLRPLRRNGFHLNRQLQAGNVCPERLNDCPDQVDACLFACGVATTTKCGSGFTSSWVQMTQDITTALSELQLECLGFPNTPGARIDVFEEVAAGQGSPQMQTRTHRYDYFDRSWKLDGVTGVLQPRTKANAAPKRGSQTQARARVDSSARGRKIPPR